MAEWVLKYADSRGEIHHQVAQATSEKEVRERYTQQGFLIYSVQPRKLISPFSTLSTKPRRKLNLEKFLIFNQQFVTLIRAGLPILKSLDLLAERLTDPKLGPYVKSVRDDVRDGTLLSEAFRHQGIFPKIYVTSVMAGEKAAAWPKCWTATSPTRSYPGGPQEDDGFADVSGVLVVLVVCLMVFLVTYVVPTFADLYTSMQAQLPAMTDC